MIQSFVVSQPAERFDDLRLRTVEPSIDGNLWLTTSTGGDKDSVPNNSNERIFKVDLGG